MVQIKKHKGIAAFFAGMAILSSGSAIGEVLNHEITLEILQHYNKNISDEIVDLVMEASDKFEVSPIVIASIIAVESSARPNVISKGGDYGLMQVRWKVHHKDIKKNFPQVKAANDLLDPEVNIFTGTEIFSRYYAQKGTLYEALKRYSGGSKTMANRVIRLVNIYGLD